MVEGGKMTDKGGAGPANYQLGSMGERWKLPHQGLGRSPSLFATFALFKSENIAYIIA